jgi:predicted enzyme related to lactoylglutathione lyase
MSQPPRIQNVVYATRDMERSRSFYEAVLGGRQKFADGDRWTQYDFGGRNFSLGSPEEARLPEGGACIVFEVAELDVHARCIAQSGGRVIERRDMGPHGTVLIAADPDGNIFQLWQRPPG